MNNYLNRKRITLLTFLILGIFLNSASSQISTNPAEKSQLDSDLSENLYKQIPMSSADESSTKNFSTFETIERNFDWTESSNMELQYNTPSLYNSTKADINLRLQNLTATEQIIGSSSDGDIDFELAQGFNITKNSFLLNFSIFGGSITGKAQTHNIQIRNDTQDGISLYSVSRSIVTGWNNFILPEPLFLETGKYFIWMDRSIKTNDMSWEKSNVNNSETLYFDAGWYYASYDLRTRVYTSNTVNPEDVSMVIGGVSVSNTGEGTGSVTVSKDITGSTITLAASATQTVGISYSINATYNRNNSVNVNYTFISDIPNWNISLNLNDPGVDYYNYKINITGIQANYYDLQLLDIDQSIAFSRYNQYNNISFSSYATNLLFRSPNYISLMEIPVTASVGLTYILNTTSLSSGNVSVKIFNDNTEIYSNTTNSIGGTDSFEWYLSPSTDTGSITYKVYYFENNQVGYLEQVGTILKVATIEHNIASFLALDTATIEIKYKDLYLGTAITGGNIEYEIEGLSGNLQFNDNGNYSNTLDLNAFSIAPGSHTLHITANQGQYTEKHVDIPIMILNRSVDILVSRNVDRIAPGKEVIFTFGLTDKLTSTYLSRPVDLKLYVLEKNEGAEDSIILYQIIPAVTAQEEYTWEVPNELTPGIYDVYVEINSQFYSGSETIENALTVAESLPGYMYLLITLGVISISTLSYVTSKRRSTKRSIKGYIFQHKNGTALKEKIPQSLSKVNPMLISSAINGIMALIGSITGKGLRSLKIGDSYMELGEGDNFWLVLFMDGNPSWVTKNTDKCVAEINADHKETLENFRGKIPDIDINKYISKHYGNTSIQNIEKDEAKDNLIENIKRS